MELRRRLIALIVVLTTKLIMEFEYRLINLNSIDAWK
jgi:hypothetical protein